MRETGHRADKPSANEPLSTPFVNRKHPGRDANSAQGKGSREAAYMLGRFYLEGGPVEKDPLTAIRLFREAAEHNHISALFDLAVLTFQKQEGAPSLEEAIQFARRAEVLGHGTAARLREALEKRQLEERSRRGAGAGGQGLG